MEQNKIVVLILTGLVVLLGLFVVTGWFVHIPGIIQVLPNLEPVQFNTALGFLLVGVGLFGLISNYSSVPIFTQYFSPQVNLLFAGVEPLTVACVSGIFLLLLSGVSLSQYVLSWNSGLDQLFINYNLDYQSPYPGRMSPNTSLCFLLTSIAVIADCYFQRFKPATGTTWHNLIPGAIVLLFGTIALVGYVSNVPTAYGWGNLPQMALHTSIGFILTGLALIFTAKLRSNKKLHSKLNVSSILLFTVALGLMLLGLHISQNIQYNENLAKARQNLNAVALKLSNKFDQRLLEIGRLAQQGILQTSVSVFSAVANTYFDDIPSLTYLEVRESGSDNLVFSHGRSIDRSENEKILQKKLLSMGNSLVAWDAATHTQRTIIIDENLIGLVKPAGYKTESGTTKVNYYLSAILDPAILIASMEDTARFDKHFSTSVLLHKSEIQRQSSKFSDPLITVPASLGHTNLWISASIPKETLHILGAHFSVILLLNILLLMTFVWALHGRMRFKYVVDQMQIMQDNVSAALIMVSPSGEVQSVNATAETIFGWKQHELIGKSVYILIPADFHSDHKKWQLSFIKTGQSRLMGSGGYIRALHKNGHELAVKIGLHFIQTEDGLRVLATISDLTEQKKLEQELAFEKQRLENTLLSMANGVWGVDRQGSTTFINPAGCKMLGYEPTELLGQRIHEIVQHSYANGKNYPLHESPTYSAFSKGETHESRIEILWRKDGTAIPVDYITTPLKESDRVVGAVVVFNDISERLSHEVEKQKYTTMLEEMNKNLEEFNYVASHDLREPLRTISSFVTFLKKDISENNSGAIENDIEFIHSAVNRMTHLIDDLLALSRIGRITLNMEAFDLEECIGEIKSDLHELITETNSTVMFGDKSISVYGDKQQLQRAFQNLIQNAIKFQSEKNPEVKIFVKELCQNNITICFRDNGIGIEKKYHQQIFSAFKRLHGMEEYEGSGIGLAIVKKIIERHGGAITLESEFGQGTTFYVSLGNQDGLEHANRTIG